LKYDKNLAKNSSFGIQIFANKFARFYLTAIKIYKEFQHIIEKGC